MPEYEISIDVAPLVQLLSASGEIVAQNISNVVAATAQSCWDRWTGAIMVAPGISAAEKLEYAGSVKVRSINGFEAEIWSDYKYASEIETGRPARDLKRMLDTSTKVRISAKGARYLIIPMRHNTPGNTAHADAMPQSVYDIAKNLSVSSIVGTTTRLSGLNASSLATGAPMTVPQNIYNWGGRLAAGSMGPNPKGKTDKYAGMVRVPEASGGSGYLTFRVMSERSAGWIIPAKPGLLIVSKVVDEIRPLFDFAMEQALKDAMSS